jgi:hypothetical protein
MLPHIINPLITIYSNVNHLSRLVYASDVGCLPQIKSFGDLECNIDITHHPSEQFMTGSPGVDWYIHL